MLNRDYCIPGTLLQSTGRGVQLYVFPSGPNLNYNSRVELETIFDIGDFFIWLQKDFDAPSYCCFCLHNRTGRILSLSYSQLEIVDLEEEGERF